MFKRLLTTLFLLCWIGFFNLVQANTETEPNDTCATAQDFTNQTIPLSLTGGIAGDHYSDFYKFKGTPGTLLSVDIATTDLASPNMYMTLYDSDCTSYKTVFQSIPLTVVVPENGIFIVNVQHFSDFTQTNDYTLSVKPANKITGITAKTVDLVTGQPIIGTGNTLYRCKDSQCNATTFMFGQDADDNGVSLFTHDMDNAPLAEGIYKVGANSEQYYSHLILKPSAPKL
jgi:hypothetical protein